MVECNVLDEEQPLTVTERFQPAEGQLVLIKRVSCQILTALAV
jgi:hypothetical protein